MRDMLKIYVPIVLVVAGVFAFTWQFVDPAPPRTITIATGAEGGAYADYGARYRAVLAESGLDLRVRHTAGTVENIRLLLDPASGVDAAFVQGGVGDPSDAPGLVSLASVFREPLWVLARGAAPPALLSDLRGRRIAVGAAGSGTRVLAHTLLAANGIDESNTELRSIGSAEAMKALEAGEIDAAFFVTARPSPALDALIRDPAVHVMDFRRADAYQRLHRYLTRVTVPEGVLSLEANLPPGDLTLVAPTAALVVHDELHPALKDLLLGAAMRVHRPGGLFADAGEFPSTDYVDFPLSDDAARYFKSGPTFLRRVLPFWAAVMVERLLILLLPLITVMIPLFRLAPPAYRWRVRRRIYRWYKELREIEETAHVARDAAELDALSERLDQVQDQVGKLKVPLSYAEDLYHLRLHVAFLKNYLAEAGANVVGLAAAPRP